MLSIIATRELLRTQAITGCSAFLYSPPLTSPSDHHQLRCAVPQTSPDLVLVYDSYIFHLRFATSQPEHLPYRYLSLLTVSIFFLHPNHDPPPPHFPHIQPIWLQPTTTTPAIQQTLLSPRYPHQRLTERLTNRYHRIKAPSLPHTSVDTMTTSRMLPNTTPNTPSIPDTIHILTAATPMIAPQNMAIPIRSPIIYPFTKPGTSLTTNNCRLRKQEAHIFPLGEGGNTSWYTGARGHGLSTS